jgi:hypothetical protein
VQRYLPIALTKIQRRKYFLAMQVVQLILKVRHRPCSWLRRRVRYTQIDSHAILVGPWLRKDERRTRPFCLLFLYIKRNSSSSRILTRINFSCDGSYLRADIRTGSAPSRSLMTRGFTFAGGSAPSLSMTTSFHLSPTVANNLHHPKTCLLAQRS